MIVVSKSNPLISSSGTSSRFGILGSDMAYSSSLSRSNKALSTLLILESGAGIDLRLVLVVVIIWNHPPY